jgi:uncharacterized protein (TIGR02284 family)
VNNDHDVKTLNNLIETTLDSFDGYAEAAKDTDNAQLKSLFVSRSTERRGAATKLQQGVRSLGGEPENDGVGISPSHVRQPARQRHLQRQQGCRGRSRTW